MGSEGRVRILLFCVGFFVGLLLGGALVGHLLIDPLPEPAPAKYRLGDVPRLAPVPPYTLGPQPKLWSIDCISEIEKDCEQEKVVEVPAPSTAILVLTGLLLIRINNG